MTEEILRVGEYFNLIGSLRKGRLYKAVHYTETTSQPRLNQPAEAKKASVTGCSSLRLDKHL